MASYYDKRKIIKVFFISVSFLWKQEVMGMYALRAKGCQRAGAAVLTKGTESVTEGQSKDTGGQGKGAKAQRHRPPMCWPTALTVPKF